MKLTMTQRVDAGVAIGQMISHSPPTPTLRAIYSIASLLGEAEPDMDRIIASLKEAVALPREQFRDSGTLARVMYFVTELEIALGLPSGSNGRPGYAQAESMAPFFNRAAAEFEGATV